MGGLVMKYLLLLSVMIHPAWSAWQHTDDCEGWHVPAVLGSMAMRYKLAIGDESYVSGKSYQWSTFYSLENTPELEAAHGPTYAIEGLKKILFKEVLKIYPYCKSCDESDLALQPFLEGIQDSRDWGIFDKNNHGDDKINPYKALKQEFDKDFYRVWAVKVGMISEQSRPMPLKAIFLIGQNACGHWVGLSTFSMEQP